VLVDGVECFEEILVGDHAKGRESGEVGSGSVLNTCFGGVTRLLLPSEPSEPRCTVSGMQAGPVRMGWCCAGPVGNRFVLSD
jgi:hypothetical protein